MPDFLYYEGNFAMAVDFLAFSVYNTPYVSQFNTCVDISLAALNSKITRGDVANFVVEILN